MRFYRVMPKRSSDLTVIPEVCSGDIQAFAWLSTDMIWTPQKGRMVTVWIDLDGWMIDILYPVEGLEIIGEV
ncbi:MAG: hypothetical protein L0Y56_00695 [Nitrospira sp.]|nr:hypothetical protein [Nitrospira sp.]